MRDLERTVDAGGPRRLHLHLSGPRELRGASRAHRGLWKAAFSRSERYTTAELAGIVAYAHARGVAVLPEIDTPSHSKSLCAGAPPTVCMETCAKSDNWPLRPVERSFRFLHSLWAELDAVFPFAARHVGGDEVETKCWETDTVSAKWMKGAKLTDAETWVYFLNRNVNMSIDAGRRAIAWNDAFRDYGDAVSRRTTLIFWTSNPTNGMQAAADLGMDVISASGNPNYLSNANDYTVRQMYDYDPCDCGNGVNALACVNTTAACAKVLGIEAAFWTSDYDASQLDNGLWPRTAALAKRGWSVPGCGTRPTTTTTTRPPPTARRPPAKARRRRLASARSAACSCSAASPRCRRPSPGTTSTARRARERRGAAWSNKFAHVE